MTCHEVIQHDPTYLTEKYRRRNRKSKVATAVLASRLAFWAGDLYLEKLIDLHLMYWIVRYQAALEWARSGLRGDL